MKLTLKESLFLAVVVSSYPACVLSLPVVDSSLELAIHPSLGVPRKFAIEEIGREPEAEHAGSEKGFRN
jgi:hypothetical protein